MRCLLACVLWCLAATATAQLLDPPPAAPVNQPPNAVRKGVPPSAVPRAADVPVPATVQGVQRNQQASTPPPGQTLPAQPAPAPAQTLPSPAQPPESHFPPPADNAYGTSNSSLQPGIRVGIDTAGRRQPLRPVPPGDRSRRPGDG